MRRPAFFKISSWTYKTVSAWDRAYEAKHSHWKRRCTARNELRTSVYPNRRSGDRKAAGAAIAASSHIAERSRRGMHRAAAQILRRGALLAYRQEPQSGASICHGPPLAPVSKKTSEWFDLPGFTWICPGRRDPLWRFPATALYDSVSSARRPAPELRRKRFDLLGFARASDDFILILLHLAELVL